MSMDDCSMYECDWMNARIREYVVVSEQFYRINFPYTQGRSKIIFWPNFVS